MRWIALTLFFFTPWTMAERPLHIAVAANFKSTLQTIATSFEHETGQAVVMSSASTGILYNQITRGAPFDLFLAADSERPQLLVTTEHAPGGSTFCYARGKLVLLGSDGSLDRLADPAASLSIANPTTAPYGTAAEAVLARPQFDPGQARKLVTGSNVVQAYQFWHSGGVKLALIGQSLTPGEGVVIPANWYPPLEQHGVVLARGLDHPASKPFVAWLHSDEVRSLIQQSGYDSCQ